MNKAEGHSQYLNQRPTLVALILSIFLKFTQMPNIHPYLLSAKRVLVVLSILLSNLNNSKAYKYPPMPQNSKTGRSIWILEHVQRMTTNNDYKQNSRAQIQVTVWPTYWHCGHMNSSSHWKKRMLTNHDAFFYSGSCRDSNSPIKFPKPSPFTFNHIQTVLQ